MFLKYQQFTSKKFRDENPDDNGAPVDNNPAPPADDAGSEWQSKFDVLMAENERLNAKITEANKHTKAAERQALENARAKAEADGNFEQLFNSSETERKTVQQQLEELQGTVSSEKLNNRAMKIAGELAEGYNIETLGDIIARRLKVVDNVVKVIDDAGNLTVATYNDLKNEFAGSARYSALIKGNQSSGGSATGGENGGSTARQTISRAEFEALNPAARMKFSKSGGTIQR